MNTERDKFLTEAMGGCCHEWIDYSFSSPMFRCNKCGTQVVNIPNVNDFSTWEGFGKLWEWIQKMNLNGVMSFRCSDMDVQYHYASRFINPDIFADVVYEYLRRN